MDYIGFRVFPKLGVPFWGSKNKDYSILGSRLGFPYLGTLLLQSTDAAIA